jgi:hypothetical protein
MMMAKMNRRRLSAAFRAPRLIWTFRDEGTSSRDDVVGKEVHIEDAARMSRRSHERPKQEKRIDDFNLPASQNSSENAIDTIDTSYDTVRSYEEHQLSSTKVLPR